MDGAGGLRWGQTPLGQQGPSGGGYSGPAAGALRHSGHRARPGAGGRTGGGGTGRDRRDGNLASVDQGYTGTAPQRAAAEQGIALAVVKLPDVKRGFALLPRWWVIERDFAWLSRFRRPARDQERLAEVLEGVHLIAFTMLMWKQVLPVLGVL